jgi:hypothetical protein
MKGERWNEKKVTNERKELNGKNDRTEGKSRNEREEVANIELKREEGRNEMNNFKRTEAATNGM